MPNRAAATPKSPVVDRRALLACASALTLTGCGGNMLGLGPGPAPALYVLHPAASQVPAGPPVSWALAVARPAAPAGLDTDRIAVIRSATTMDYYANAAWPDSLSALLQTALVAAFEDCGRIPAVGREGDGLKSDYRLDTEIRDFAAHYETPDGAPQVHVALVAKMVGARSHAVAASLTVDESADAAANSVDAAVEAFDRALGAALAKILAWALALPPPAP